MIMIPIGMITTIGAICEISSLYVIHTFNLTNQKPSIFFQLDSRKSNIPT